MTISLRDATISDAASLAAISIEVWVGTYLKAGVTGFFADYVLSEFTCPRFETLIEDPAQRIIVSDTSGGLDGFIRITRVVEGPVAACSDTEIATLYVQPRHHGKGIGAALLTAAMAECRAMNIKSLWLATNAENTPALEFYAAQGFSVVGETHFRLQDEAYLNTVLSKDT